MPSRAVSFDPFIAVLPAALPIAALTMLSVSGRLALARVDLPPGLRLVRSLRMQPAVLVLLVRVRVLVLVLVLAVLALVVLMLVVWLMLVVCLTLLIMRGSAASRAPLAEHAVGDGTRSSTPSRSRGGVSRGSP